MKLGVKIGFITFNHNPDSFRNTKVYTKDINSII